MPLLASASALLTSAVLATATPAQAPAPIQAPSTPSPIIGGDIVPEGEWTGVVAIASLNIVGPGNHSVDLCSGVLLDSTHVLTAAHCFDTLPEIENTVVVFGNTVHTNDPQVVAPIESYAQHPDYCLDEEECDDAFDFGVITLGVDIGGVEFVPPLLDQEVFDEVMQASSSVTVVGFGTTREVEEGDPELAEDEVGIKREVAMVFQRLSPTGYEFIAGSEGKDACGGDSGGPAFVKTPSGEWRLAGIVSRGVVPCGTGEGYYGTVFAALPWIKAEFGLDLLPEGCDALGDEACLDPRPPRTRQGCAVTEDRERPGPTAIALLLVLVIGSRGHKRRR